MPIKPFAIGFWIIVILILGCSSVPTPPADIPWEKPPTLEDRFCIPITLVAPKESAWNKVPFMSGKAGYDFIKRPGAFVWDARNTVDVVSPDGRWFLGAVSIREEAQKEGPEKKKKDKKKEPGRIYADRVIVWDLTDPEAEPVKYSFYDETTRGVSWVAFTPDSSAFLVYRQTLPGSLTLHDRTTGKIIRKIPITDPMTAGTISSDGQTVALAMSRSIELWNLTSGQRTALIMTDKNSGFAQLRFSLDGRFLFAATPAKSVKVFDLTMFNEIASIPVGIPCSMDVSPDGHCLLICSATENKSLEVGDGSGVETQKDWASFGFGNKFQFYEIGSWRLLREELPANRQQFDFRNVRFSWDAQALIAAGLKYDADNDSVFPKTVLCRYDLHQVGGNWTELDYKTLPLHPEGKFLLGGRKESVSVLSPFERPN